MSENLTAAALPVGHQLDEYVIEQLLGQGGFGITYLARDTRLGAKVAIKEFFPQSFAARKNTLIIRPVPPPGGAAEKNYQWGLQEFLKEAQALARFKHPNIVRVLRFLEANGTAYMVMEYEQGESLAGYLKRHGGFLEESALMRIFLPILSGLQAVHEAGLVHLDIKPDNIYLRQDGEPMLIDFGSSRQSREDPAAGRVALTPGYSAPEQYPGLGKVGPSSDLYSIGATLYRCITGQEPIDAYKRQYQFEKAKVDPQPPACKFERPRYSHHIRETIDAALKLDPAERPDSASALQFGLMGKGLNTEASKRTVYGSGFIGIVRTATEAVKKRRAIKRGFLEKLFVVLLFTATVLIVTGKILVDTGQLRQEELYALIEDSSRGAVDMAYNARDAINRKLFGITTSRPRRSEAVTAAPLRPKPKPAPEKTAASFSLERTLVQTLMMPEAVHLLAISAEHDVLVAVGVQGRIQLWRSSTGKSLATFRSYDDALPGMAISAKGAWLAFPDKDHRIVLYDLVQRKTVARLSGHTSAVTALAFSPDGRRLVSSGEDLAILLWDVNGHKRIKQLGESKATILSLTFSPNGRLLAAGDRNGGIRSWDMQAGERQLAYFLTGSQNIQTLAYSPDNAWLAAGGEKHFLKILDLGFNRRDVSPKPAPKSPQALAFSADGQWLLGAGGDGAATAWNIHTPDKPQSLVEHGSPVTSLAVSRDGRWLATGGEDKTVKLWQASPVTPVPAPTSPR